MGDWTGLTGNPHASDGVNPDTANSADGRAISAALLALAYEQRTASLIAFHTAAMENGARDRETYELHRDLIKRLGLSVKEAPGER